MSRPEIITYEPGTVIYREGDPAENLFFLTQGHVIARFKGREVELAPGSVLGDASLIEGVYWATVAAGESGCTLMALPYTTQRVSYSDRTVAAADSGVRRDHAQADGDHDQEDPLT